MFYNSCYKKEEAMEEKKEKKKILLLVVVVVMVVLVPNLPQDASGTWPAEKNATGNKVDSVLKFLHWILWAYEEYQSTDQ